MNFRHTYPARSNDVIAMMRDPDWLREVATRSGTLPSKISVDGDTSSLQVSVPTPTVAKRFAGDQLDVTFRITWSQADSSGKRRGNLDVDTPTVPTTMNCSAVMEEATFGERIVTTVLYEADFSVNIPFVGAALEKAAAPYIERIIDLQEKIGREYLDRRQKIQEESDQ